MQLVDALAGGDVKDQVRTVTLAFTYLGCGTIVAYFFENAMFMWAGAFMPFCACEAVLQLYGLASSTSCTYMSYLTRTWCGAGARIASKLRERNLRAALHQDITHYDTELTSGDVVSGLNADCTAVQTAISEKVGNSLHLMITVLAALIMALVRGWKLALVMIALLPLIAVVGAILAKLGHEAG